MTQLNHKSRGKGSPVVLLHGFLENNSMWEPLFPALDNQQIISIELPGHGKSKGLEGGWNLPGITETVKNCIDAIIPQQDFSVIGHSLGGYVALELSRSCADRLNKIVLLHSHPFPDKEEKKKDRTRVANIVDYNKALFIKEAIPGLFYEAQKYQPIIEQLILDALEMKKTDIMHTIYAMRDRESSATMFPLLNEKLHVIQGEFDSLIDAKMMQEICSKSNAHFHLIPNIGHMGQWEATSIVSELLKSILNEAL